MEPTTSVENIKSSSLRPKLERDAILPMTQAVTVTNSSIRTLNGNHGSTATLDLHPFKKAQIVPKPSHESLDSSESPPPPDQPPLPLSPPPLPPQKPISPSPPAQGIWKLATPTTRTMASKGGEKSMVITQISVGGFEDFVTAKMLLDYFEDNIGLVWRCRLKTSSTPPESYPNYEVDTESVQRKH
ncbi:RNA-directed RNA polymerase [Forsythia ovata]|uniref:RNA-directed RNA polymerase n=1 Tax=Forsythia ovata TaxID=205694 RepID=A0ABD1W6B6_9LAMI